MPHLTLDHIHHWTIYLWWAIVAVWLGSLPFVKSTAVSTAGSANNILQRLIYIFGLYLLFAPNIAPMPLPSLLNRPLYTPTIPIALIGLFLVLAGIAFAIWARFILGSSWSANPTIRNDHELVLRGPYRIVRHPIYTGILTALLGTAIQSGLLRGLLGVVLAAIAFRIKLAVEEQLMLHQFGNQYVEYRAHVRRLVPFLY
jgi:protein-S-isoprenylcysteine O-methyltransferase